MIRKKSKETVLRWHQIELPEDDSNVIVLARNRDELYFTVAEVRISKGNGVLPDVPYFIINGTDIMTSAAVIKWAYLPTIEKVLKIPTDKKTNIDFDKFVNGVINSYVK